jgi:hypothetical protein
MANSIGTSSLRSEAKLSCLWMNSQPATERVSHEEFQSWAWAKLLVRARGGGIWGSSANTLVDGGISAAPQWGIFNQKLGWGGGIEMVGLRPEIEVDNDPRMTFDGRDMQLEKAISELKSWLKKELIPMYQTPADDRPDMSLHSDECPSEVAREESP